MVVFLITFICGCMCAALGVLIMKGNLSLLQYYHTHRVLEEDKPALAKKAGFGVLLCGASVMLFSVFATISIFTNNNLFIKIGTALLAACLIIGIFISLFAINKYNKGIF